jgi:3-(3-hydroxy-phenyl)propionate hydroxylase
MNQHQAADVIIVGAGPVGLTLANLLGVYGIRALVIERNPRLEGEPRAVTLDDESLRTMQSAGLVDEVLKDVVLGYGVQYFDWKGKPLAQILPTRQEYGYPKRNAFRQPLLIRTLCEGLKRFEHVDVWFGHELVSFTQDANEVRCVVKTPDGLQRELSAPWLVACDGGRSPVRELCKIVLDGDTYPERWLIVDLADRTVPTRHTQTYCDPRRPAIRLPGPRGSLRYEFMLRPGDRDEDVLDERSFRAWIAKRVPEDADLPLVRKAIYGFHARVATSWRQDRVLLAGDAAHLTPPFAGQGLNSGIRDATNLAWKLAAVTRGEASVDLIDSYEQERRPHAAALIRMALRIGAFMQPKSLLGAAATQTALRLACLVPACRDYILQLRFKPKPQLKAGYFEPTLSQPHAELLPQPLVQHVTRGVVPLDQLLGDGFSALGWDTPAFRAAAATLLPPGIAGRSLALVRRDEDFLGTDDAASNVERARDMTGELGELLDRHGAVAVVVRPDRYAFRLIDEEQLRQVASTSQPIKETDMPHPSSSRRAAALCVAVAFAAAFLPERSNAQAPVFPTKPVRILTAFPAGSGPDVALRVVADRLAKKWAQPVIVENRPGGNGFIAINAFKQTAPDGYDLIQLDRNHLATHPHTFSKLPYDPQKDLEPIRPLFSNTFFIVVSKDSPYKSVDDIVAAAKAKPGQVTYGSWANGSPGHLGGLRLQKLKGIEMLHVPYKEMSQLYAAVAVQEVQWALGSAASAGPLEKAGRVRFIAVAGPTRSKAYPGVPSVDEAASTKGYEVSSWTGLFAPKGTPKALREKISADVLEAVKSPEVIERYRGFDYELFDAGPDAYAELIRVDIKSWADIIRAANLKLD